MNWKALLQETLSGLARTHAHEPLSEIQRILRGVLNLDEVHFQGPDGRELPPDAPFQHALEHCAAVSFRLQLKPVPLVLGLPMHSFTTAVARPAPASAAAGNAASVAAGNAAGAGPTAADADVAASPAAIGAAPASAAPPGAAVIRPSVPESRFREGVPSPELSKLSMDERTELFLREFIRLENRHDFMWAGYIVRELLPRLGFAPDEAKLVLDHLRAEKLVTISKVPNPKNPEFPATGVHLNHDHPRVQALLGGQPHHNGAPAAAPREQHQTPIPAPQTKP